MRREIPTAGSFFRAGGLKFFCDRRTRSFHASNDQDVPGHLLVRHRRHILAGKSTAAAGRGENPSRTRKASPSGIRSHANHRIFWLIFPPL